MSSPRRCASTCPRNVRIATPWYKPNNNQTSLKPDYYLHETDKWIVFPHELAGLSMQEIESGQDRAESDFRSAQGCARRT